MAYFPAFLKLDNKKILIVGGGYIAYEKLEHLLDFTQDISVVALEFSDDMSKMIKDNNLNFEQRAYKVGDIAEYAIVIVAVDDIPLQSEIFQESSSIIVYVTLLILLRIATLYFHLISKKMT